MITGLNYYAGDTIVSVSSITKPTNLEDGARLFELDTRNIYAKSGDAWIPMGSGSAVTVTSPANIITGSGNNNTLALWVSNSGLSYTQLTGAGNVSVIFTPSLITISGNTGFLSNLSQIQNGVTGQGLSDYIPVWVSSSGLGNSNFRVYQNPNRIVTSSHYVQPMSHVRGYTANTYLSTGTQTQATVSDYVKLSAQTTQASDTTISLENGVLDGQQLLLSWNTGTARLLNSGNVYLSSNWVPSSGDMIQLTWLEGKWREEYRFPSYTGFLTGVSSIINAVTGAGTANTLPIWVSSSGLGNSQIFLTLSSVNHYTSSIPFRACHIRNVANGTISTGSGVSFSAPDSDFIYLKTTGSNSTPDNTIFYMSSPGSPDGQQRLLYWYSGQARMPNSGIMALSEDWIPQSGHLIKLAWTSTVGKWVEEYRWPVNASSVTNGLTGLGTTDYIPKFVSPSGIGNSTNYESGNNLCTQNIISTISGLTELPSPNRYYVIDFNSSMRQTGLVTGSLNIRSINRGAGKNVMVRFFGSGTNSLAWTEFWTWMGNNPPVNILDQKNLMVSLDCYGTGYGDVFATWTAQT